MHRRTTACCLIWTVLTGCFFTKQEIITVTKPGFFQVSEHCQLSAVFLLENKHKINQFAECMTQTWTGNKMKFDAYKMRFLHHLFDPTDVISRLVVNFSVLATMQLPCHVEHFFTVQLVSAPV